MKPILFNTDMVRALLDGRKTETRRVVKNPPTRDDLKPYKCYGTIGLIASNGRVFTLRPSFVVGDILYVRETWQPNPYGIGWPYLYKASPEQFDHAPDKWRPSIHMPKEAARIFLRVTDVYVERLQDIDENEMLQDTGEVICTEGYDKVVPYNEHFKFLLQAMWGRYWDKHIVKMKREYMWSANPWVWVIEFERTEKD